MLLLYLHKNLWQPTEKWLTSEYILVPMTLDKWGLSSKQRLWQYNLQRSVHARVKPGEQGNTELRWKSYLGQCFAGFWKGHSCAAVVSHVMAFTARKNHNRRQQAQPAGS